MKKRFECVNLIFFNSLPRAFGRLSAQVLCAESQKRALGTSDGWANGRDGRYVAP
jgi:hypothetical protein